MSEAETARNVIGTLTRAGHEAYFVGGCVRDMLRGKNPLDHDIATDARPEEISALFSHVVPVGREFGVMLVIEGGYSFQVATFRTDMEYRDGRKPAGVRFCDARSDVMRRDFTVNGLLYDPGTKRVIDFVNGEADIRAGIIRTIGAPEKRFGEDKLRLLRAVRFASTLGFTIEAGTLEEIRTRAKEILIVSRERIRDELVKMMIGPGPGTAIELMDRTGLLEALLPEVKAMKGVEQPEGFHPEGDVFTHTMRMLELMKEPSPVLAFAVLFHDIGKPETFVIRDRIRFPRHQVVGAEIARSICKRLRFPNHLRDAIATCVANHMSFMEVTRMKKSTLKRVFARPTFPDELELHRLDCLASDGNLSDWEFVRRKREEFSQEEITPERLISGHDCMALGCPEGPGIGRLLAEAEELQLENRLTSREEALEWLRHRGSIESTPPL